MFAIWLPTIFGTIAACLLWIPALTAIDVSPARLAIIGLAIALGIAALASIGSRIDLVFWIMFATSDERALLRQRNALKVCKELGRWIE
jgi:hypothetical protein